MTDLEKLQQLKDSFHHEFCSDEHYDGCEFIDILIERERMKWISVKDQLPPLLKEVLMLVKEPQSKHLPYDSRMKVGYMYERMLSDYYETEESRKDILRWTTCDTPIYWCELPEPPKDNE